MTDLSTLAERLAAATGPDRELDCDLFVATAESPFVSYYPDCVLASLGGFAARVEISEIKPYTASIDAALALVDRKLPGWAWGLSSSMEQVGFDAGVFEYSQPSTLTKGYAKTAPLAILRALVAALATQNGSDRS